MGWRNLFHLGPLFIIGIIISVVWSTMHCFLWWSPYDSWCHMDSSGFINSSVFLTLSASTIFSFLYSLSVGPGYLPQKWKPVNVEDRQYLQFCTVCEGYKAPRSHHCSKRCVMKQDHHCIFINNCLGHSNHLSFIALLISAVLMCIQACVVILCTIYQSLNPTYYYSPSLGKLPIISGPILEEWPFVVSMTSLGLAAGVVISLGFLLILQGKAVFSNQTWIEDLIHDKAVNRREGSNEPPFAHPYNLGWRENFLQVINWSFHPKGNGVDWKVRKGSHLYAFTIEQIEQKKTKLERSANYVAEKSFNGSCLPVSFGIKVCLQALCIKEARLSLRVGDKVAVSRWKKHWLYGEIQERGGIQMNPTEHRPIRGWFPRSCCSLFTIEFKINEKCE